MRIGSIGPRLYNSLYYSGWRAGQFADVTAKSQESTGAADATAAQAGPGPVSGRGSVSDAQGTSAAQAASGAQGTSAAQDAGEEQKAAVSAGLQKARGLNPQEEDPEKKIGAIKNPGASRVKMPGKKSSPAECETCSERKYQDGSDECNVSFKAAAHISPTAAGAAVRAHEQEHVDNAYKKAKEGNGKVLQASVAIHTSICPECGRTYVSGGETTTKIAYGRDNDKNPFLQNMKNRDAGLLRGMNFSTAG